MSRWTAAAEEYIVDKDMNVVAGPFARSCPAITLIDRAYQQRKAVYSCASRYYLGKHGHFKRSQAGDAALAAAVQFPALAEQVLPLLGRATATLGGGYDAADWAAIDALLMACGMLTAPLPAVAALANDGDLTF